MRRFIRLRPLDDLTIQIRNLLVEPMKRVDQDLEDRSGDLWERLVRVLDSLHQLRDMSGSFGHDKAELGQMPAQGIDDLGPLPHQEIAGPEHESGSLGLLAFGSHEAHGRALGGLADRLGICGIVLLPLDERLDVRRRDQPDRMPEHADLAGPIMGAAAGLHGDRAGGLGRQERANLAAPLPLAEHNRS
jgi:hypothetical protein